jgi:hypothetical protein
MNTAALLAQASNPLTPIYQWGATTGSAIICCGLFIWSQIQIAGFKRTIEENTRTIGDHNKELRDIVAQQIEGQRELIEAVGKLAEAVARQSESHAEQLSLIHELASEQKVMMANQMSITNGFQRVVEQLIEVVKD